MPKSRSRKEEATLKHVVPKQMAKGVQPNMSGSSGDLEARANKFGKILSQQSSARTSLHEANMEIAKQGVKPPRASADALRRLQKKDKAHAEKVLFPEIHKKK